MSLKLKKAEIIALLSKLGVQAVEVVDERADGEAAPNIDEIVGQVDTARADVFKAKYGEEIGKEAVTKAVGKLAGSLTTKIKRESGLKEADIEGLELEDIITKALETVKTSGSSTVEQVREQMKALGTEWEAKYNKAIEDATNEKNSLLDKFEQVEIDKIIVAEVNKLPISKGDKVKIAKLLKNEIIEEHALVRNGEKIDLRNKDNKDLPVLKGNAILTLNEALKEKAETLGLLATDMRDQTPPGQDGKGGQQSNLFFSNGSPMQAQNDFAAIEKQMAEL